MFRKLLCLATTVLLLSMAANVGAGWFLWDGEVSDEWNDPANWWDVDAGAHPAAPPDWTQLTGIGSRHLPYVPPTYWPVIRNTHWDPGTSSVLPGVDQYGWNAYTQLFGMSEWGGVSQLTFDGGILWQSANSYFIVGRGDSSIASVSIMNGGIDETRWLRIGVTDGGAGGPNGEVIMTGGYANVGSLWVGEDIDAGDSRGYLSIENATTTVVDFWDPHFRVGPAGTIDIEDGGVLEILALNLDDTGIHLAEAIGAINLHEGGTIEFNCEIDITNTAELLAYFDYDDGGGGMIDGNVNAIAAGGGPGTFKFTQVGYKHWLVEVPEPATIALLGLGGIALLRRKR